MALPHSDDAFDNTGMPATTAGWRPIEGARSAYRPPLDDPSLLKLVLCPVPDGKTVAYQLGKLSQLKVIRDRLPHSRFARCVAVGLVGHQGAEVPAILEEWVVGEEAEGWLDGVDDTESRCGETAAELERFTRCRRARVRVGEQFLWRGKDLVRAGVVWLDAKLPNAVVSPDLDVSFIDGATAWEPGRPLDHASGTPGHYGHHDVVSPAPSTTADYPALAAVLFRLVAGVPVPLRVPWPKGEGGLPEPGDAVVDLAAWHQAFTAVGASRQLAEAIRSLRRATPDDRGDLDTVIEALRDYAAQLDEEELPAANRRWPWWLATGGLLLAGAAAAYLWVHDRGRADRDAESWVPHRAEAAPTPADDDAALVALVVPAEPGTEYDLHRSVVTPPVAAPAPVAPPARVSRPPRGTVASIAAVVESCGRDRLPTADSYRSVPATAESWAWFDPGAHRWRVAYPGGETVLVRESDPLLASVYFRCSG